MKRASASLVVLSVIFLITAALLYLFEYVSIERMMYINRSRTKQYEYNFDSIENIARKDIEETYLAGGDIYDFKEKTYKIFDEQSAVLSVSGPTNKDAFSIKYTEHMPNKKDKSSVRHYSILNKIFFDTKQSSLDKQKFYEEILSNDIKSFSVEEINNYFLDLGEDSDRTFNFDNNIVIIDDADEDLDCNIKGEGILIIDSDLHVKGNIEFTGLIIINGKLSVEGNHKYVYGYVLDIKGKSHLNYIKSLALMHDTCKGYKGIINISRYK